MRSALTTLTFMLVASSHAWAATPTASTDLFVAPHGSDAGLGTKEQPFETIAHARDAVRDLIAAGLTSDVKVYLRDGTYRLSEPLTFGPEDSGTGKHAIMITAFPDETVVVSGGRPITGFRRGEGQVWTTSVPGVVEGKWYFRHLFVSDRRAVRARTPNQDAENPCWQLAAADLASDLSRYTITLPGGLLGTWSNPRDIEVMVAGNWAVNRLPVESTDSASGLVVLAPPHAVGHSAIRPGSGRRCYFENAPEMLDQPGQWYLDRGTGVLSYWPLADEDMTRAVVIAPALQRLVEVKGTPQHPVRNLHFRGIRFEHAGATLPAGGYMGIQACHCTVGKDWTGSWGRVPAAIRWDYAEQCSIEDGAMAHLGGCGFALVAGCHDNLIQGNHVYDVMNRLCDGGCIYTLGFQPGTMIRGNHLHDVHRSRYAQGAPNNGMFIDQGSKGFLFENNVIYNTAAELVRFNQCARDWHTWRNNHFGQPAEVKESGKDIIAKAGLQPPYRDRLRHDVLGSHTQRSIRVGTVKAPLP